MKIRPVILCGGAGTRLWEDKKHHQPKQFIDFGGWNLMKKTLERIKNPIFDYPIISTNNKYLSQVRKSLKNSKIKKFKIVLEPAKKNTAPAILSSALIKDIPLKQSLMYFAADHLIEKTSIFNRSIKNNVKNLDDKNIFIFGIKPTNPSSEYGYFLTKKIKNINKVSKFIEKPNILKAKQVIKKKGYWNSGMFFLRKDSIINNFKKYQPKTYKSCLLSVNKSKYKNNTYYLNKSAFIKSVEKSFDYAILEKSKNINAIKLDIPWSDLGSWKEICKMYGRNKKHYYKKKNVFHRPWGSYVNLFNGKEFLIKELYVKPKGILSLQKHHHRAEHWVVTQGKPKITLNKKYFTMKPDETIFIPLGAIHRIENPYKKPVKIIEAQVGSILKETDIVRYQDVYGRVK
jgi:mannose-1-phosphate guanylyltransferase/mannose-6-phosphate isomerase